LAEAPAWLRERRSRASDAARELPLPGPKVKGWEFTDLSGLELSAYEPAEPAPAPAGLAGQALAPPAGAEGLTQVDGAIVGELADELAEAGGNGKPDGPLVVPLDAGGNGYPELLSSRLGTIVSGGMGGRRRRARPRPGPHELAIQSEA